MDVEAGRDLTTVTQSVDSTRLQIPDINSTPAANLSSGAPSRSGQPNSAFQKLSAPFRSFGSTVKGWEVSGATMAASQTKPIPDTIYVREFSDDSAKQALSEHNGETESLLSADEKEEAAARRDMSTVRTKEEEHQLLLRALQKRFVSPSYAAKPALPSTPRPSSHDLKVPRVSKSVFVTGHMPSVPAEKGREIDALVNRLEEALHQRKAPFDVWENLLDKFSLVQQKQLVLNYANLEIAWSKNMSSGDDENGSLFREHLTAFQEMMDELSRDVLLVQGIDPRDSSETLPRRSSSDQPDLQALHSKLFRSQNLLFDPSTSLPVYPSGQMSGVSVDTVRIGSASPTSSASVSSLPAQSSGRLSTAQRSASSKAVLSEPPKYPPPPFPPVV